MASAVLWQVCHISQGFFAAPPSGNVHCCQSLPHCLFPVTPGCPVTPGHWTLARHCTALLRGNVYGASPSLSSSPLPHTHPSAPCVQPLAALQAGGWWRASFSAGKEKSASAEESGIGVFLSYALPPGVRCAGDGAVRDAAVGPVVDYTLAVGIHSDGSGGASGPSWDSSHTASNDALLPLYGTGGVDSWGWQHFEFMSGWPSGRPITLANFRKVGSPVVRDGKMKVKITVNLI